MLSLLLFRMIVAAAVRSDARETREAIAELLNNEDVLLSVCLSQVRPQSQLGN